MVVIEVEARFAEAHDLLVLGLLQQRIGRRERLGRGFVRMDAHRAVDVARTFGDRTDAGKPRHTRSDGQEVADALRARGIEHAVELGREIGKIEMAMAIDKHGPNLSD